GNNDEIELNDDAEASNTQGNEDTDMDLESSDDSNQLSPRPRRPPGYLSDYVTGSDNIDHFQNLAIAMFRTSEDPTTYKEAAKLKVWREAMESEINAIES
ncbi:hypothetical protein L195_g062359, partial [Trifolium pratense]